MHTLIYCKDINKNNIIINVLTTCSIHNSGLAKLGFCVLPVTTVESLKFAGVNFRGLIKFYMFKGT